MKATYWGYERENGRIGVRNHVLVMPLDDLSNAAAVGVEKLVHGVTAVPHPYGRLQFGPDLDLYFRTLAGFGRNPNVASVIVVGIEPNWTEKVTREIAKTGKPVEGVAIEGAGDLKTIERASRVARDYVIEASEKRRKEFDASSLMISTKCGESDTTSGLASNPVVGATYDLLADQGATLLFGETSEVTGAEHLIADRAISPEVRQKFLTMFTEYNEEVTSKGADLLGSQPTQGNIKGGLSTIEEKALGNVQKMGQQKVVDVLQYAEEPRRPGLSFMNTSSAGAEAVTLFAAAGAVLHIFTTGQGNIVGNPIIPVLKTSANPRTVQAMREHIDLDHSGLLSFTTTLDQEAQRLFDLVLRTSSGRLCAAEVLGHVEFSPTKLHISA
jgi:(2R)-sulfolactate sulfo-lyase subunit beta